MHFDCPKRELPGLIHTTLNLSLTLDFLFLKKTVGFLKGSMYKENSNSYLQRGGPGSVLWRSHSYAAPVQLGLHTNDFQMSLTVTHDKKKFYIASKGTHINTHAHKHLKTKLHRKVIDHITCNILFSTILYSILFHYW